MEFLEQFISWSFQYDEPDDGLQNLEEFDDTSTIVHHGSIAKKINVLKHQINAPK